MNNSSNVDQYKKIYDNITRKGYHKIKLFTKDDIDQFKKKIVLILNKKKLIKQKFDIKNLSKYHQIINEEKVHKVFSNPANRYFKFDKEIIKKINKNKEISHLIKKTWGQNSFDIKLYLKNNIKKNYAAFRLARPYKIYKDDVGGAHLDLHFNNKIYSDYKILYTFWTPIIGFDKKYTLRIAPNSHKHKHNIKNLVVQKKYISKIFKDTYLKKFDFKRIDMKIGEVLIFHPNLLHGGSKNIGDKTRVSFDFRIFNRNLS